MFISHHQWVICARITTISSTLMIHGSPDDRFTKLLVDTSWAVMLVRYDVWRDAK